MKIKRSGSALWRGGIKDGSGQVSTASGVLDDTPYGFSSRFEGEPGTNPEELIAAAHAGCFTMALSALLSRNDLRADELATNAEVTLEGDAASGFTITAVHLDLKGQVPGLDDARFRSLAHDAEKNCPVSKLLKAEISLTATLV
jgi:osmotically inducible protein OsmC